MADKVTIPVQFDPESLVYCREVAQMKGLSLPKLLEQFIEEGMRRQATEVEFSEVVEGALFKLEQAARRAEIALDIPQVIRRRKCGKRGGK